MRRRALLAFGGVGVAAALAGAWWSQRRESTAAAESPLWQSSFEGLDGRPVAMAAFRGKPLVLNFWASWCAPCVREMPTLDRFARDHADRGWQVLGLAIDRAEAVREFLAKTPVHFPVALAGLAGADLARDLGNDRGGLPFTAVFDAAGRQRARHLGETRREHLEEWAA